MSESGKRNGWLGGENQDRGGGEREVRWLTPRYLVEPLGHFGLDPCGAPGHDLANETYLLERGRVWLNPPYGRVMREWVEKLVRHGVGTALIPVATGTKLWQEVVWREASAIHFYRHRIKSIRRDLKEDAMVSPQASAIVAFGEADADALVKSDLPGVAIDLRAPRRAVERLGGAV